MSRINFSLQMNINETMQTIMAIGHELTPIVISEPGVGKSSILKMIEAKYGVPATLNITATTWAALHAAGPRLLHKPKAKRGRLLASL